MDMKMASSWSSLNSNRLQGHSWRQEETGCKGKPADEQQLVKMAGEQRRLREDRSQVSISCLQGDS
jgi:hypothetical protein